MAALLSIPPAAIGAGSSRGRLIYSAETPYQYARVVQFRDGERWLQLNEGVAVHSDYRPGSYLTGGYWDDFLVLPLGDGIGVPRRIAILGNAAGTTARAYGHFFPQTRVDAVELDGTLSAIGRRYFDLRGPRLHLYTGDARPWLAASTARYDAIFLDTQGQSVIVNEPSAGYVNYFVDEPQPNRIAIPGNDVHMVYRALLTGLVPGGSFQYRVWKDGRVVFESTAQARKSATQPYRFALFGDCAQYTGYVVELGDLVIR